MHRHTPLSKLKILSGLVSLSERAVLRIKYLLQIQAHGIKHALYTHVFAGKSSCPNAYSSWNQFQLEVQNSNQYSPYAYPFTESPPRDMSPSGCQVELISINKNLIPNYEIQTILAQQISKANTNHGKIYTDGSVQSERAGVGACIPSLNLNIYSLLPLVSSILSTELSAIQLTLDALINYNIESKNILCLSESKSGLLLLQKINRIANDKDLYILEDSFLILRLKAIIFISNIFQAIKASNIMIRLIL